MKENHFKYIGRRVPRMDAPEKVTGTLKYMTDYHFEQMVWGKVLRSKYPYARIESIDTSKAESLPGVVCVLTHKDIPGFNGFGIVVPDQPVLARDVVRCTGDAVALVAAETKEIAEHALSLIEVNYERLNPVTDAEFAMSSDAPSLHENGNIHSHVIIKNGNTDAAFEEADVILENTFYSPRQMHAFIETEGGWGVVEPDGMLTIRCPGQYAYRDRLQIARALAMNPARIRVISHPIGGAFGGKDEITVQIYLALLALHTGGRPVKIHLSREESVIAGIKRHPFKVQMKTAAKRMAPCLPIRCAQLPIREPTPRLEVRSSRWRSNIAAAPTRFRMLTWKDFASIPITESPEHSEASALIRCVQPLKPTWI